MSILVFVLIALLLIQLGLSIWSIRFKLIFSFISLFFVIAILLAAQILNVEILNFWYYLSSTLLFVIYQFYILVKATKKLSKLELKEDAFSFILSLFFIGIFFFVSWLKNELFLENVLQVLPLFFLFATGFSVSLVIYQFREKKLDKDFTFNLIIRIATLRTLALERLFTASEGDFVLKHFTHRKTLSEEKIHNVLGNIFQKFYPIAAKCFKHDSLPNLNSDTHIENKYTRFTDAENAEYELVTREYIKEELHPLFNYFLIKNQSLIASMALTDKMSKYAEDFVRWANKKEYNTVLLNDGLVFNNELDDEYYLFDRVYQVNQQEKSDILQKLNNKAPVVKIAYNKKEYEVSFLSGEKLHFNKLDEWANLLMYASNYFQKINWLIYGFKTIQFLLFLSLFFIPFSAFYLVFPFVGMYIFTIILIHNIKFEWKT